jgi:hypothetical protein
MRSSASSGAGCTLSDVPGSALLCGWILSAGDGLAPAWDRWRNFYWRFDWLFGWLVFVDECADGLRGPLSPPTITHQAVDDRAEALHVVAPILDGPWDPGFPRLIVEDRSLHLGPYPFTSCHTEYAPSWKTVDLLVEIGRAAAVLGALTALATFWPREYGNLDVALVAASAGAEHLFMERILIQAQKEIVLGLTELIVKKIRRLRTAMVLIASASVSIALGLALD